LTAGRAEDIEPNIDFVFAQFSRDARQVARFNKESPADYLAFAT
jgi:sigma54-dependent transcription regulator